jgi:hypothetical protein
MRATERSSVYPGLIPCGPSDCSQPQSALLPEPILTVHEYLMKAGQDDPRWAGKQDHLLLEARRARRARRQHSHGAQVGCMRGQRSAGLAATAPN